MAESRRADGTLRTFASRRPEWFAVLTTLAYALPLLGLRLLDPEAADVTASASPAQFVQFAWMVLVPAVLLTALGCWGAAGFTGRPTWRSLVLLLPLILLYVVVPVIVLVIPALSEFADHSLGYFALVAVAAVAVGFGDEATFRGVIRHWSSSPLSVRSGRSYYRRGVLARTSSPW
ncbi:MULTISPECIES: hypothetical protein [Gordonia]|uniref:Uncharacterized protein n=1 Tax=Gordonia amicalis TaxID=89053 RepID=A0AAE4R2S5_9ACTN|nr:MULTISPECIES: hypothetical protein [Gordonia]KAF0968464.1 hypothetical protein BPODLACK_03130 [Gordonia sp. YY1]MCZ0913254.1 hypothetical protein [Gordonia amicalis]MCZ4577865.1 hypothetical protein [Gordonia amicalis]MCZ4652485.1 hypothetical protein [Gordonia amicalis]MDJ0451140.1 hypothetical protein [Gordonia amicalis]